MKRSNLFDACGKTAPGNVTVTRTNSIITVGSSYNVSIPQKAHALGGHFNREMNLWIFPRSKELQVQQLFTSTFGKWDSIPERRN